MNIEDAEIVVGMSGGVDSSVAAWLLQSQGYTVAGLFMKNWQDDAPVCLWETDVADAMRVCDELAIAFNTVDLSQAYQTDVFADFVREYRSGRTPNPDVFCNQSIKFDAFLQHALSSDKQRIATGHYAQILQNDVGYELHMAVDSNKDQTYFLYRLQQPQLARTVFPIGHLQKSEVRAIAKKANLGVHNKKDSVGICFIGKRPFREFLGKYIPPKTGEIQTLTGQTIGQHDGVWFYTLGQRQGLGIGGLSEQPGLPWYVIDKDIAHNRLIVGQGEHHPALYKSTLCASNLSWIAGAPPALGTYHARIRHRQKLQICELSQCDDMQCTVRFNEPQRAVVPGQSVVLYQGSCCLGGGIIASTAG